MIDTNTIQSMQKPKMKEKVQEIIENINPPNEIVEKSKKRNTGYIYYA